MSCIDQFAGITANMRKNFVVHEAVVGKMKRKLMCCACNCNYKCQINVKWSNDPTTEEKVEGVHKEGMVGEIRW